MNEIYWLTRLGEINILLGGLLIISVVISGIFFVGYGANSWKVDKMFTQSNLKTLKLSIITSILLAVIFVLIPSKKDALLIWGVGGTIDYIKSNETAKQLPDKCIQALDKFVDEYMLNEDKEDKEK